MSRVAISFEIAVLPDGYPGLDPRLRETKLQGFDTKNKSSPPNFVAAPGAYGAIVLAILLKWRWLDRGFPGTIRSGHVSSTKRGEAPE